MLDNVYRTNLVLASGKLVPQKIALILDQAELGQHANSQHSIEWQKVKVV